MPRGAGSDHGYGTMAERQSREVAEAPETETQPSAQAATDERQACKEDVEDADAAADPAAVRSAWVHACSMVAPILCLIVGAGVALAIALPLTFYLRSPGRAQPSVTPASQKAGYMVYIAAEVVDWVSWGPIWFGGVMHGGQLHGHGNIARPLVVAGKFAWRVGCQATGDRWGKGKSWRGGAAVKWRAVLTLSC